jgi:hypothetical protein
MPVVNSAAAGLDVGSRSHFVAIGQNKDDVKEFCVYTEDLHALCKHLVESGRTTVALESTGPPLGGATLVCIAAAIQP